MTCKLYTLWFLCTLLFCGCYSFKGISIPPTISTFFVDQFQNGAGNAPPDIGQRFSDILKDRVLNNSRLNFDDSVPDIEFTGTVSSYSVQSVAPERRSTDSEIGEFGSSLNRLSISIQVDYVDNLDDESSWNQSFSFFEDFESATNLSDVEDELIESIFDQITTDIFNKSFTNW